MLPAAGKAAPAAYLRGDYEGKLYAGHPAFEWVLAVVSSITALKVIQHTSRAASAGALLMLTQRCS